MARSAAAAAAAASTSASWTVGSGGMAEAMSTAPGRSSSTEPSGVVPGSALIGAPKLSDRPLASAANFALSTWLIAKSTMKRHMSRVTMSA